MKKIIITFIILFGLTGCFGDNSNIDDTINSNKKGLEVYSTGTFEVAVPRAWEKYSSGSNIVPKPIYGKIVLVSVSKTPKLGFYNNLVILSQDLNNKKINSYDYSVLNNNLSKDSYLEYKLLKSKNISFLNGKKSKLFVFKARYNNKTPKATFIQSTQVCGNTGYLLTIGLNQIIDDTDKYEKIIETFTCKNDK